MLRIVGSYISPYVRKVLVCLDIKNLPYELDPIVPFYGNDQFAAVSPLRRIPVLIDGDITIPDSTIICEYLEDRYPDPPLYPRSLVSKARARWLEEYADSRMGEVFIWRFFNQLVIRRAVWGEQADTIVLQKAREEEIPQILDYLEQTVPHDGHLFGEISVADISLASFFRNIEMANFELDGQKWPKTRRFVTDVLHLPGFQKLFNYEELSLRTPIERHRETLLAAGAPISSATYFSDKPRRGVMGI